MPFFVKKLAACHILAIDFFWTEGRRPEVFWPGPNSQGNWHCPEHFLVSFRDVALLLRNPHATEEHEPPQEGSVAEAGPSNQGADD